MLKSDFPRVMLRRIDDKMTQDGSFVEIRSVTRKRKRCADIPDFDLDLMYQFTVAYAITMGTVWLLATLGSSTSPSSCVGSTTGVIHSNTVSVPFRDSSSLEIEEVSPEFLKLNAKRLSLENRVAQSSPFKNTCVREGQQTTKLGLISPSKARRNTITITDSGKMGKFPKPICV